MIVCFPGQDNRQSSKKNSKYQLLYPYGTRYSWLYINYQLDALIIICS